VILDLVDLDGFLLAVFHTGDHTADACVTHGARAEAGGVWQQGLKKLDGDDLLDLEFDGLDAGCPHCRALRGA